MSLYMSIYDFKYSEQDLWCFFALFGVGQLSLFAFVGRKKQCELSSHLNMVGASRG